MSVKNRCPSLYLVLAEVHGFAHTFPSVSTILKYPPLLDTLSIMPQQPCQISFSYSLTPVLSPNPIVLLSSRCTAAFLMECSCETVIGVSFFKSFYLQVWQTGLDSSNCRTGRSPQCMNVFGDCLN